MRITCKCKRGIQSNWDFKCGHCRTKSDWAAHTLMMANATVAPGRVTVINRHHKLPSQYRTEYIGRGSALGNPFPINESQSRREVIELYKKWLAERLMQGDKAVCRALDSIANTVLNGHPVRLECYCSPQPCHGDVIKELVDITVRRHLQQP